MGRRGKKFLCAIKKFFSLESKEKKGQKSNKWGFGKSKKSTSYSCEKLQNTAPQAASTPPQPVHPLRHLEEIKLAEAEQEKSQHVYSVAIASAAAAEAAVAAAKAAAEVVRLSGSANFIGNSREVAAIKIQTSFRGYLARRALRALKGLVRLKSHMHGNGVKRQATTTLRCMQTLARVQSQIRSRRIRMLVENQNIQRQLLLKRERELESMLMSEEWDDSLQSKEQIEACLLSKQEALLRRERALAYAFSHQWKSPSRSVNPTFLDTNNPQWGWSWLERWMMARPRERRSTKDDKELNDQASLNSVNGGKITKAYYHRGGLFDRTMPNTPQQSTRPPSRQLPATPPSRFPSGTAKIKSASPRNGWRPSDDDTISMISLQSERPRRHSLAMISLQSERPRRHSLAGSSVRDDESLTSSVTIPSYMAPTESARAKNRFHGSLGDIKIESTAGKDSANSVKKRLSFPPSPAAVGRHSATTREDASVAVEVAVERR